jgi:hypothetical protein
LQEVPQTSPTATADDLALAAVNTESSAPNDALVRIAIDKLKETKKIDDEPKSMPLDGQAGEDSIQKSNPGRRTEVSRERNRERMRGKADRERVREREDRSKGRDRDSNRERDRDEEERI